MQQVGNTGFFPVSDTSEKTKFGKIVDVKNYAEDKTIVEIQFEDKSRAFLKWETINKDSKEPIFDLQSAVDSLGESNKPSGPKIG